MTKAQRIVLAIGVVSVLSLGLYPPWLKTTMKGSTQLMQAHVETTAIGHYSALSPPSQFSTELEVWTYKIDYQRWFSLIGIVVIATLGAVAAFSGGKTVK